MKNRQIQVGTQVIQSLASLEPGLKLSSQGLCPAKGQRPKPHCPLPWAASLQPWVLGVLHFGICQGQEGPMGEGGKRASKAHPQMSITGPAPQRRKIASSLDLSTVSTIVGCSRLPMQRICTREVGVRVAYDKGRKYSKPRRKPSPALPKAGLVPFSCPSKNLSKQYYVSLWSVSLQLPLFLYASACLKDQVSGFFFLFQLVPPHPRSMMLYYQLYKHVH